MRGFLGHVWVAILAVGLSQGWRCAAHVHHVVGEDRGWETSTNAGEWSARKVFRVGDKLWYLAVKAALTKMLRWQLQSRHQKVKASCCRKWGAPWWLGCRPPQQTVKALVRIVGLLALDVFRNFGKSENAGFAYSAAMEGVVEVGSREEFDACDLSNPLKMYSDGLDKVELDREGIRYFASSRTDSCKNGLKLHLHVQPFTGVADLQEEDEDDTVAAAGPIPSASSHVRATSGILGFALPLLCFLMTRI